MPQSSNLPFDASEQPTDSSRPATNLDELLDLFEPTAGVDPGSSFYISRNEIGLKKLTSKLARGRQFHGFFCGHVGSGKTTELKRLAIDPKITKIYLPLFIAVSDLQVDHVNLTHDTLLINMGLQLVKHTNAKQLNPNFEKELNDWGTSLVKTFFKEEEAKAEVGSAGNAWFAFFRASLQSRNQWKQEEVLKLEPKIADLIGILNRMAADLENNTGKKLLVIVDDLEKGSSEAEKQMHRRLFTDYYNVLTQPTFNIIYTLPVYFKSLPSKRIDNDAIFSFSALRLYAPQDKAADKPTLDKTSPGYLLMSDFITSRLAKTANLFEEGTIDELILIGGGLFRETDSAIASAAFYCLDRDGEAISLADCKNVFNDLKKDYQPSIYGNNIAILAKVMNSERGWVEAVEPFLQSRAVVEYENGDIWLDVRYVLKAYLRSLIKQNVE